MSSSSRSKGKPLKKVIKLKISDDCVNYIFKVKEDVIVQSKTIKHMIEVGCADGVIPISNVTTDIFDMVIKYCKKHLNEEMKKLDNDDEFIEEMKKWDAEFIDVDKSILFNLIMAANFLCIRGLLDLACQKAADMIKGKRVEEIREIFNIENDFTPEEEEELIQNQNTWTFD
ncbi:hypothetical protein AQUCO_00200227v1 [Aquilegia coerulea]|uniref:SKP1-like protein n=1 Tax=Aquilegia coerulea TaxID=218851 RepID=A0A2G5F235_AQUCA|nr:hypothetical protein AQUCO_00200227v1 [Aquilegia coerulea]